jgi:hypothetical protein
MLELEVEDAIMRHFVRFWIYDAVPSRLPRSGERVSYQAGTRMPLT